MIWEIVKQVLIEHQRKDIGSCTCGWGALGKSFPGHQTDMIKDRIQRFTSSTEGMIE